MELRCTAAELAVVVACEVVGSGDAAVTGFSGVAQAQPGSAVFAEKPSALTDALASAASVIVTGAFARGAETAKTLLVCAQPKLAFARMVAAMRRRQEPAGASIHPTAVVDERATIGRGVRIGARAVVEAGVVIGDGCEIGPGVVVHTGTTLGCRVDVHAGAVLGGAGFGFVPDPATGRFEAFPQLGTLEVGDDVSIGANVTIDRGTFGATVIGSGTKIDNLVQIAHNVQIGRNVVIAAQTGIAGSAVVEDGVILGGQVGLGDHVRIGAGARLGAQGGVPSNKVLRGAPGEVFWGTPARPLRQVLREQAVLARLARRGGEETRSSR